MARLLPFAAVRPPRSKAGLVSTRSYVSYTPEHLRGKQATNPFSFLHVIHPLDAEGVHGSAHRSAVRAAYEDFLRRGYLVAESQPALWIYRQESPSGHRTTGLLGLVPTEDVQNGTVKAHEKTLAQREDLFAKYLSAVGFHAEPVLLAHRPVGGLQEWLNRRCAQRPEAEFATADGSEHALWVVQDPQEMADVERLLAPIDALYIADGHHRCASSARLNEGTDGVLAFVLADEQLVVHPFHRVVHAGAPDPVAWEALARKATITPCSELPDRLEPGTLCVVHGDQRWLLVPHDRPFLDVDWCSEALLAPLWGIHDLRTDKRLTFVPGTESLPDFAAAQSPEDWWIGLAPTPWSAVEQVADRGESMPPKSTYIEPKLRSGVTLYAWK